PPPLPKVIRSLILGGISKTEAKASLIQTVPALNPSDLASMIDLEYALVGRPKTSVASRVREFALAATAPFEATTCDRILGLETERDKRAGRKELERLVKSGRLERLKRNLYGPVNRVAEPIDWRNADTAKGLDLRFPLDLHGLFQVIPSSLVVVAGTLGSEVIYFCLNLIHLNQDKFDIHLITDSAVANPIALRKAMDQFGFPVETWRFSAERPGGEIHKSIKSSALNIVLFPQSSGRPGDEYYLTGPRIADIQKALGSGTAVVGLLKNPEKEIGRGGWPTIAPATVAVNLDASLDAEHPSKLTIVEARFPLADGVRGRVMRYRVGRNGVFTKASQSRGAYERE
ncbi:MAG: hypothetical protein KJ621_20355, partial [Proteobacteria bacterium]|nr:hypothetical protein [Pseudomonadota bacterium]